MPWRRVSRVDFDAIIYYLIALELFRWGRFQAVNGLMMRDAAITFTTADYSGAFEYLMPHIRLMFMKYTICRHFRRLSRGRFRRRSRRDE